MTLLPAVVSRYALSGFIERSCLQLSTIVTTSPLVPEAPVSSNKRRKRLGKSIGPYLFVVPATLFLLIFLVYPVITMLIFSFEQVNIGGLLTGDTPFVGFDNYRTVLSDAVFRSSVGISIVF